MPSAHHTSPNHHNPSGRIPAAAPEEAAAAHKEDSKLSTSFQTLPAWRQAVIAWYSGDPKPGMHHLREARRHGLPDHLPYRSKDRVKGLALAGFDVEDIMAAVPELNPIHVAEIVDRIPGIAHSIIDSHLAGYTPLEISNLLDVPRPNVYYWLRQANLRPLVRRRTELTNRQREQVLRAWKAGEAQASIARRFGISYDQVRHAVRTAS